MYVCLVEGCPDVFESSKERHGHLVGVHLYPKSFDFTRYILVSGVMLLLAAAAAAAYIYSPGIVFFQ